MQTAACLPSIVILSSLASCAEMMSANLQDAGDDFQKSLQRERRFGSFKRSWSLPEDADVSAIRASVQHGILSLTISKTKPSEPEVTSIPIN